MINMKKFLKFAICFSLITAFLCCLCACSSDDVATGLNNPVTHENITISITDIFGTDDNTYIVAKVKLSEHESVYDGRLNDIIVSGKADGYIYECIGYDEEAKEQTYMISIGSVKSRKIKLEIINYDSVPNPMQTLCRAKWLFSVNRKDRSRMIRSTYINDDVIEKIEVYDRALILIPKEGHSVKELSDADISLIDKNGNEIKPAANSIAIKECNSTYGKLLLNEHQNAKDIIKVKINDREYPIHE